MKIRDVMTLDVHLIDPDARLAHAAQMMRDLDVGSLPVQIGDRLVGMVTDRDIVVRGLAAGLDPDAPVSAVMSEGIKYCYDDQAVAEVAANMGELKVRRLPVVTRDKRLVGFVSLANIAAADKPEATGSLLDGIAEPH